MLGMLDLYLNQGNLNSQRTGFIQTNISNEFNMNNNTNPDVDEEALGSTAEAALYYNSFAP